MPIHTNPESALWTKHPLWSLLFIQLGVSLALSIHFFWRFNTDAIAYLRLAGHLQDGNLNLSVSGYWGPLLTWVLALFPLSGLYGLIACRAVMILSGILFTLSAYLLFKSLHLSKRALWQGTAITVCAASVWQVMFITPDLLSSSFLLLFLSGLASGKAWLNGRSAFICGLYWGLAYLAKAVAFPVGCLWWFLCCLLRVRKDRDLRSVRPALWILVGFLILGLPWMSGLTLKYARPQFSSSGPIAHSVVGPDDIDRYHPSFRTWHTPEPGRLTSWEDPTRMKYESWSPLGSSEAFKHQITLVLLNGIKVIILWTTLWLFWPFLIPLLIIYLRSPQMTRDQKCILIGLLMAAITASAIYLPVYVGLVDQRYFYLLLPIYWVLSQLAGSLPISLKVKADRTPILRLIANQVPSCTWFLLPVVGSLIFLTWQNSGPSALKVTYAFATKVESRLEPGPLGGSASIQGERAGLYLAHLLGWPWHGDGPIQDINRPEEWGIRYLVVRRGSPLYESMTLSGAWKNTDSILFESKEPVNNEPLVLFENLEWADQPL